MRKTYRSDQLGSEISMTDVTVQRLDNLAGYDPEAAAREITGFMERDDALQYVPSIFQNASSPMLITAAIKIIEKHVQRNWRGISEEHRSELRGFVETMCRKEGISDVLRILLTKVLIMMVLRSGPEQVNLYMEHIFVQGDYASVAEFLAQMRELTTEDVALDEINVMKQNVLARIMDIFVSLMTNLENPAVDKALTEFAPYLKWEILEKCNWDVLLQNENPVLFGPLCTLVCVEGVPPEFVVRVMQKLVSFDVRDPNVYARIVPALQKHLDLLQESQNIRILMDAQRKLMDMAFTDNLDYWEAFVLSTFAKFKETAGASTLVSIHKETLEGICNYVIRNMTSPSDFFVPGEYFEGNDECNRLQYDQMKTMLLAFITMMPVSVMDMINSVFEELRGKFDEDLFLCVVWSLGCISGATSSKLELIAVIDSLKFLLEVFRAPGVNKPVVASAFLYLAGKYAKAQKLTPQFIEVAINLGVQSLTSEKIQKMGVNCLLAIGKYAGKSIERLPTGLLDVIMHGNFAPEIFEKLTEATARIFNEKGKIAEVVDVVRRRWTDAVGEDVSFETARVQRLIMNGFVGLAKANPGAIENRFREWKEDLSRITRVFGESLIRLGEEHGDSALGREDVQIMMGFLRAELTVFTILVFKDCSDVFELYRALPEYLRLPETLKFTEILLRSEVDAPMVRGLRETVVDVTKDMVSCSPDDFIEFYELVPRVLGAIVDNYWEAAMPEDLEFLIGSLSQRNHAVVLETIKALDKFIAKGDLKLVGEPRGAFFGGFLCPLLEELLLMCCQPTHYFCYPEASALVRKLFDFVGTGKLNCQLFPEQENVPGLAARLSHALSERFPLVSVSELNDIMNLLLTNRDQESFDALFAQFISRAKQTTAAQTLAHLKVQRLKEYVAEFS